MGISFRKKCLRFVGTYASERGIKFKNGISSDMLWRRLKRQHSSFSPRALEATGCNRHSAMNKDCIVPHSQ